MAQFRRDSRGIAQALKSGEFQAAVRRHAELIAGSVRSRRPGVDVVVDDYDGGDRAASSVTVRDRRALAWQAQDGDLTRAAAAQGLEVTERRLYTTKAGRTRYATEAQIAHWTRGSRR